MRRWAFGACLAVLISANVSIVAQRSNEPARVPSAVPPQATRPPSEYRPVATVKDIMEALLEPATEVIFDAVSPTVVGTSLEKEPASEEEWNAIRNSAVVMSEAATLLTLGRRPIDTTSADGPGIEKPVEQMPLIARRVAERRARWNKLAQGLVAAAAVTTRAVETRDARALLKAGDVIDAACEACHHEFWYGH